MSYLQVVVPTEAAADFLHEIGKFSCLQMTDLNGGMANLERPYMRQIIKLKDLDGAVKKIEKVLKEWDIETDEDFTELDFEAGNRTRVDDLRNEIYQHMEQLVEQRTILDTLQNDHAKFKGMNEVYMSAHGFLEEQARLAAEDEEKAPLNSDYDRVDAAERGGVPILGFRYVSGIIPSSKKNSFQRQIFLITRGNSLCLFREIEDDDDSFSYMIFYLGDRLGNQMRRICKFMMVPIYLTSEEANLADDTLGEKRKEAEIEMRQLHTVIASTERNLLTIMRTINVKLKRWKVAIVQEKGIFSELNKLKVSGTQVHAHGWCCTKNIHRVRESLDMALAGTGSSEGLVTVAKPPRGSIPPTHFDTNKFTAAFQAVVNTYGIPRYREYNPTVPTLITFPFLFAMMYGDMFHGSCIFFTAAYIIWNEDEMKIVARKNELIKWLYGGRYLLILMGFFAMYTGLMYNEILSYSVPAFGPSTITAEYATWTNETAGTGEELHPWSYKNADTSLDIEHFTYTGVYPFGVDPHWYGAANKVTFVNSFKMKLSVIIGVGQMSFGLVLCALNHIEYGDYISLIFEWSFQVVFMLVFFVWMDFCIIYKWCLNWVEIMDNGGRQPPSIINILVNMVLSFAKVDKNETQLFESLEFQHRLELFLVIMFFLSIPCMMFLKPCVLYYKHKQSLKAQIDDYQELTEAPQGSQFDNNTSIQQTNGLMDDSKQAPGLLGGEPSGAPSERSGSSLLDEPVKNLDTEALVKGEEEAHGLLAGEHHEKEGHGHGHGHGEEFEMMEVMIHQLIHIIEYVLGTISNTASYLRLWALSLAHSELAEVFGNLFLGNTISANPFFLIGGLYGFWGATLGVLLCMDQLECFLHALRLHWVEFQNKFYNADGIEFMPFSYSKLVDGMINTD